MFFVPSCVTNYFTSASLPIEQKFKVDTGPFKRVQNLYDLAIFYKNNPNEGKWIFSATDGPFRDLGEKTIKEIVEKNPQDNVIYKLNNALFDKNRTSFEKLVNWIKSAESAELPAIEIDITKMYDGKGKSLLFYALEVASKDSSKLFLVDALVKMGVDINELLTISPYYNQLASIPPLTYAWIHSSNKIVVADYLLALGAKVDQKNNIASYLLNQLSDSFDLTFLNWYVQNNGDINFADKDGNTLLHQAAVLQSYSVKYMQMLLDVGANSKLANNQGDLPIHLFCKKAYSNSAHTVALEMLLKKDPEQAEAKDNNGHTPLYFILQGGKLDFIKTLYAGWDKKSYPENSQNLLFVYLDFIKQDRGADMDKMKQKVEDLYMPLMEEFLSFFASTPQDARKILIESDGKGNVMLHHVASACPLLIQKLLADGFIEKADLKIVNSQGSTVKQLADKIENTLILLSAIENFDVDVALHWLEHFEKLDQELIKSQALLPKVVMRVFREFNEDPKESIWAKGFAILEKLLECGLDPNEQDKYGQTALIWGVIGGFEEMNSLICKLLDYGANPLIKGNNGQNALDAYKVLPGQYYSDVMIKDALEGACAKQLASQGV